MENAPHIAHDSLSERMPLSNLALRRGVDAVTS